jgi:chromosome segregation ATPase
LPNNKTQPSYIEDSLVKKAEQIAKDLKGTVVPANRLISFDSNIRNPIMFVFGKTFVCSSIEIAKRVAFDA